MEEKKTVIRAWIKDMAHHESIQALADGFLSCLPVFDGNKAAVDIEQMIVDTKNAILLTEAGKTSEVTRLCFKLQAQNRVLRKWREIQ